MPQQPRTKLQDAIQDYLDVRTANAFDMTPEQVKVLNRFERDGTVESITRSANGLLVEWAENDPFDTAWPIPRYGLVKPDGSVTWNP